jgi:predicted adenylyl cyclase CyaB
MIEVESKIKISNPKEFKKLVSKLYKFKSKQLKLDDYYTLGGRENYARKSIRIRNTGGKNHTVNFKQRLSYLKGVHAKDEKEFDVENIQHFIDLIVDFGFKKWLSKEKHSETYQIKKNLTVEINKVKSLGYFCEIEYLVPNKKDIPKARKEILSVMKKLNLNKEDVVELGYSKMLWALKHK